MNMPLASGVYLLMAYFSPQIGILWFCPDIFRESALLQFLEGFSIAPSEELSA